MWCTYPNVTLWNTLPNVEISWLSPCRRNVPNISKCRNVSNIITLQSTNHSNIAMWQTYPYHRNVTNISSCSNVMHVSWHRIVTDIFKRHNEMNTTHCRNVILTTKCGNVTHINQHCNETNISQYHNVMNIARY